MRDKSVGKIPYVMTIIIIILTVIATIGGLNNPNLYNDNNFVKVVWRSNDLLTLVLIVPIMIWSIIRFKRNSCLYRLIWMGTIGYTLYNYMFYLYGAAFNSFFLLYVLLLALSIYTLIMMLVEIDINDYRVWFNNALPKKRVSGFMFTFVIVLGGLWTLMTVSYLFTKKVPAHVIQTGHTTAVVFATDLTLLISTMLASGIMLWRGKIWGCIFSVIVLFKASAYGLALIVMTVMVYMSKGITDPILPLYIFLWLGSLISLIMLLRKSNKDLVKGVYKT